MKFSKPLVLRLLGLSLPIAIFLLVGCRTSSYSVTTYPGQKIYFGKGGGVAGVEKTYCLLGSGAIFQRTKIGGEFELKDKVRKRKARKLFKRAEELNLSSVDFKYPGNVYYFLEIPSEEDTNRITWGSLEHPPQPAIDSLYQNLMRLTAE